MSKIKMMNVELRPIRTQAPVFCLGLASALLILTATTAFAQLPGTENGEWRYLGQDLSATPPDEVSRLGWNDGGHHLEEQFQVSAVVLERSDHCLLLVEHPAHDHRPLESPESQVGEIGTFHRHQSMML